MLFEGVKRLPIEKIDLGEVFKYAKLVLTNLPDVDKVLLALTVDKTCKGGSGHG